MWLGSKNREARDAAKVAADQRDKVLAFKRYFGSKDGQEIMLDLMNKFHILNPLPKTSDPLALARAEGERDVVLYILGLAHMDVTALDKVIRGDFS